MQTETITVRFEADTSAFHNALDDVLDHIDEVNEAMGVYASGVLDDEDLAAIKAQDAFDARVKAGDFDDEFDGPAIGDIVQLASGSPDMTVISVCECNCVEVAWYDDNGMNVDVFPVEALVEAD